MTMTGSQIRTELTKIIDSLVAENCSFVVEGHPPDDLADKEKRSEAIDILIKIIGFYREDL